MQDTTGSATVVLFSALAAGGHAQDTVPSDPNVAYTITDTTPLTTTLSRFTSVSERLVLATPPSNATGDPTTFPSLPPFFYHFPVDDTWYGYQFQAAIDQQFTTVIRDYTIYATVDSASPLIPPAHTYNAKDFIGDNTYYWRVRPVYTKTASIRGAWSLPGRFKRQGFVPQNLQTSVTFATPTFTWDVVEGARSYDIQVDDDPQFGSTAVNDNTARNSYAPITTLANGTYYWRVRVRRYGGSTSSSQDVVNDWSPSQVLTLTLPQPTGLTHNPSGIVPRAPTLCWSPIVSPTIQPVLAAYKYRVQVSKDPAFSSVFDTIDTEQACWTPAKGYDDGTYYWRVAMMDGNSTARLGSYTSAITFTKQYPAPTLVSPTSGGISTETPTFVWMSVNGADSYKLEVSQSPTFSPLYDVSITTNNTRYTPTKAYATGITYYWRVAIVDDDGKVGPFNNATIILQDAVNLSLNKAVTPALAAPGQAITYTLTFSNTGNVAATGVVITDLVPLTVTNLAYTRSGVVITATPGITYSWRVSNIAPGASGVITIAGVLRTGLAGGAVFTNTATITGTVTDLNPANNSGAAAVTILSLPPVAVNDTYTTPQGITLTVAAAGILANDTDLNNDPLTVITLTNPFTGTLDFTANGAFTYTPPLNFKGVVTFTYQAYDGAANSNTATATIMVNAPPTISNILNQTININTTLGPVAFTISDLDAGDTLTVTGSSSNPTLVPNASIVFAGSGPSRTLTITPTANLTGTAIITVTVSDGLSTASDTFLLTVNTPPTISDIPNQVVNMNTTLGPIAFTIGDLDVGNTLTVTGSSSDPALVPNANIVFGGSGADRTLTITPVVNLTGTASITVTVSDGLATASDTFLLTINTPPTISNILDRAIDVNTTLGPIAFTVGDLDAGTSLTVTGSSSNPTLAPNANIVFGGSGANRTLTITPTTNVTGTATITVTVSDGLATASDSFVLIVNTPPTISDISNQAIDVNTTLGPLAFTVGDADAGDTLTVTGSSSNLTLVPNANIIFGGSGQDRTLTITPTTNQTGAVIITITVSDSLAAASDTFVLTVNALRRYLPLIIH
jgi:hypothetical protein